MRNAVFSCVMVLALQTALGGGTKMEIPPVKVRSTVRGVYEVRKGGGQVGREDFIRTYFSNNTIVYESVFEVAEREGASVSGNNRLEVEEDSGFPRSYYSLRRSQSGGEESVREVKVDVYANVAVVSERRGDDETRRTTALPTGCPFFEGNIASHLSVLLDRYDRSVRGKQTFRTFDPLGGGMTNVAIEALGDTTSVSLWKKSGKKPQPEKMTHYRYIAGASTGVDFFVDASGRVAWIDAGAADLAYALVSLEER